MSDDLVTRLRSRFSAGTYAGKIFDEAANRIEEQASIIETARIVSEESTRIIQKQREEISILTQLLSEEKDKVRHLIKALRDCGKITAELPGKVKQLEALVEKLEVDDE